MQIPRRAWAFVALTALLSLPLYVLAARSPGDNVPVIALMWAPGLAAILVTLPRPAPCEAWAGACASRSRSCTPSSYPSSTAPSSTASPGRAA